MRRGTGRTPCGRLASRMPRAAPRSWPRTLLTALGTVALLAIAPGCGGSGEPEAEVVLYVSAPDDVVRAIVAAFEDEHDVRVRTVGDGEARATGELVNRLRAEADDPQADVYWSSEALLTVALADEGVLAPSMPPAAAARPARSRDPQGRWHGFAARARVVAFDPEKLAPEDVPRAWSDLAHDRWDGRIVMADPRVGTTGDHLGVMQTWWDRNLMPGFYDAWLLGLRDANVRLLPGGNAAAVRAILDGQADLAMTDTDEVRAAQVDGARIDLVYPRHAKDPGDARGTLLIPTTVGLVAGGPNPEAGLELVDFLLSPTVERILAESDVRNVPLHPELAGAYPELDVPAPIEVDLTRAAAAREAAVARALRILVGPADGEDWPDAPAPAPAPAAAPAGSGDGDPSPSGDGRDG